jgi:Tfp pilus assembly protein FimV
VTTPSGPRLVRSHAPAASEGSPAPPPRAGIRRWFVPLALAALLIAVVAWAQEAHRAAALEARVATLTRALASARTEVAARRAHLAELRAGVDRLEDQVGSLKALADRDPTAPAAPAPGAPAPSRPTPLPEPAPGGAPAAP